MTAESDQYRKTSRRQNWWNLVPEWRAEKDERKTLVLRLARRKEVVAHPKAGGMMLEQESW